MLLYRLLPQRPGQGARDFSLSSTAGPRAWVAGGFWLWVPRLRLQSQLGLRVKREKPPPPFQASPTSSSGMTRVLRAQVPRQLQVASLTRRPNEKVEVSIFGRVGLNQRQLGTGSHRVSPEPHPASIRIEYTLPKKHTEQVLLL